MRLQVFSKFTLSTVFCISVLAGCGPNSRGGSDNGDANTATSTFGAGTTPAGGTKTASSKSNLNSGANPVHSINMPHDEAEFPPGAGRETFMSRCMVCHSLRYVTMQPDFPEATWVKEVDKMRHTWGAHVTDEESKEIVSYLVLIKGKK